MAKTKIRKQTNNYLGDKWRMPPPTKKNKFGVNSAKIRENLS